MCLQNTPDCLDCPAKKLCEKDTLREWEEATAGTFYEIASFTDEYPEWLD